MPSQAPFPTGEPFVIVAEARIGELPLIDTSAIVDVNVTVPNGTELTFGLNDIGEDGDVFAEDGVFSATVPAQEEGWIGRSSIEYALVRYRCND